MTEDAKPEQTAVNDSGTGAGSDTGLTQRRSRRVHPGYVYFIHGGDRIKIGYSREPKQRLSQLQVSTTDRLQLIGTIVGDKAREKFLQDRFEHLKIRGEWFRIEPDLVEFICQVTGQPKIDIEAIPGAFKVSAEAQAMLAIVLSRRNQVGAETAQGEILSNLAEQAFWLDDEDPRPWATHPMQTVKGMMEWQTKLLATKQ